jgi:queuine/archaeosine tRNA-ribosyltransferase
MEISQINSRSYRIETNGKQLLTPFFYPSISSIKTNFKPEQYFEILQKCGYPAFLISSYDLYNSEKKSQLLNEVTTATQANSITLLDSGHYEAYWNHDKNWGYAEYESVVNNIEVDFCFSYDVFWNQKESITHHIDESIKSIAISAGMLKSGETIPLLHLPTPELLEKLPEIIQTCDPKIIGLPERELGASLFERAKNVKKIRDLLDSTNRSIPLHLLGTGNPISILIYSLCGADLFDGLEWCQTVVNSKTGHLFHFAQKELLPCDCEYCKSDLPYSLQTLGHNLKFMQTFISSLQQSITTNNLNPLLERYLEKTSIKTLQKIGDF